MAAEGNHMGVPQMFDDLTMEQIEEYFLNGILEMIGVSPIGEILYNQYVKIKICQRLSLGWNEIHNDPHFFDNRKQMFHPFSSPHQIDQGLLLMHDAISPYHELKEQILRLFERYYPQDENITDTIENFYHQTKKMWTMNLLHSDL